MIIAVPVAIIATILTAAVTGLGCSIGNGHIWGYYPGHWWAKVMTRAFLLMVTVEGRENLEKGHSYVFVANHQGMFDVLAIAATCDRPIGAVLKKELYNIPFLHQIALCTKSFAMDREDVRQSLTVIQNVTNQVKGGRAYLIFPEGTRSRKGNEMLEFHGGSFRCATKSGCPIVPIALVDCFKVLDQPGSKPVSVQVHYLKPITSEEYAGMKPAEVAVLVKARIQEKLDECLAEK